VLKKLQKSSKSTIRIEPKNRVFKSLQRCTQLGFSAPKDFSTVNTVQRYCNAACVVPLLTKLGYMGVGGGQGGPWPIWNLKIFLLNFSKKGRFLSFEWAKSDLATLFLLENSFGLPLEKSTIFPLEKIFRRSCLRLGAVRPSSAV